MPAPPSAKRLSPLRRPPHLRAGSADHRQATWLELFFDLVFVAAVARLAHALYAEPDALGLLRFVAFSIPVAWAWMGFTYYANRFDSDDLVYRLTISVAMIAVASMALQLEDFTDTGTRQFAESYAAVQLVLLLLYARARRHVPEARAAIDFYLLGFGLGFLFWLGSAFVPPPARYVLWAVALFVAFATPLAGWSAIAATPIDRRHLAERFGLFTIIVMGETVLAVVVGTGSELWTWETATIGLFGFLTVIAMWWIYFDFEGGHSLRPGLWGFATSYGHLPLWMAVTAFGAGVRVVILDEDHTSDLAGGRWAIAGGAAVFLLAIGLFHLADRSREHTVLWATRLLSVAALVALAAVGGALSWSLLLAFVALLLVVCAVVEGLSMREVLAAGPDPPS